MARVWWTERIENGLEIVSMPDYLPVTIFADSTGQYTEDECVNDNLVEIPVPNDLLYQWWIETCERFGPFEAEFMSDGQIPINEDGFKRWVWEESTAMDTEWPCCSCDTLYDWLRDHNYYWKRLD